ncbi:MAG: sterol carrier protein domain-containing protein, partial [Clostridia bacterium]
DKGVHIEEQNSMGIINICSLLRTVCNNKDYSVKVTDSFYNKNNGVYLFNGDNSNGKYHLEMTSGQLIRLITGHMSLDELVTSENAVIYDTIACREISNMLPKVKCFIVDEY